MLLWNKMGTEASMVPGVSIFVCVMPSSEGEEIYVTTALFLRRREKRGAQWRKLTNFPAPVPCGRKIFIADHNSFIVRSRDSKPVFQDKNKAIVDARETPTRILRMLQLEDAYIAVNADPSDRNDPPPGFTFGFGGQDECSFDTDDGDEGPFIEKKSSENRPHPFYPSA